MIGRWFARAFTPFLVSPMLGYAAIVQAASITLNGALISGAETRPDITVNILEFREGGSDQLRLSPGVKRYGITIVSRDPIALLESQLAVTALPTKFTIGTDGRTF